MKIADISFSYDDGIESSNQLLHQHATTKGWATSLKRKNVDIVVAKRYKEDAKLNESGVSYHFIKDNLPPHLKPWQVPFKLIRFIKQQRADIVHVHGFMFPMAVFFLRLMLGRQTKIIVQHHAGKPSKGLKAYLYTLLNSVANGYFFTTNEHAMEWFGRPSKKVMPIMEGSNYFSKKDKEEARAITKMQGSPIFLWVGRLDANKDPLAVLDGFEQLLKEHSTATLYMVFGDAVLKDKVLRKIDNSTTLQQAVYLIGNIAHQRLEAYYNSADYFVLGSHYEGSGYALSEALACGCIPIVTDIPSFRMMTNNGTLGALWQTGNRQSFVDAANAAMKKDIELESKNCLDFFKKELSFDAIADKAIGYYQQVNKKH